MIVRAVRVAAVASAAAALVACSPGTDRVPAVQRLITGAAAHPTPTSAAPATASAAAVTAAAASPAPNPCAANTAAQLVKVSIRAQHLWMCAGHTLVRDTAATTGIPGEDTHTPTGTFRVQARTRNTTLTLISGQTYAVKYWIPFDGPLFGFHDASWQNFAYGSAKYKTAGSHGCVHMPVQAIAFLYRWVDVGATVRIRA